MSALEPYKLRAGKLVLTVEPLFTAGHGVHERTWVARVDVDVPEYRTTTNVAMKRIGAHSANRAYAKAFNVGHRLFITALVAGVGK